MVRVPCCDKERVTKGTWSAEEDAILRSYIERNGPVSNWISLPSKIGLNRCGKSCRLRWLNYLRPDIRHGGFTEEEDRVISNLYFSIGRKWSVMAEKLQGRTDNDIKNYWHTKLKRKLIVKQKKTRERRSSNNGVLRADELHNNTDCMDATESNPNSTPFTITNIHLMSSNWTRPAPQLHLAPTIPNGWPPFSVLSFSTICANCNKQQHRSQQHRESVNLHEQPIIYDIGSSSAMQQNTVNNEAELHTMLRDVEAALAANGAPPSQEIGAPDNDSMDVPDNDASYGESMGSWEWDALTTPLLSFPMDDIDDYIDWDDICLPTEDQHKY